MRYFAGYMSSHLCESLTLGRFLMISVLILPEEKLDSVTGLLLGVRTIRYCDMVILNNYDFARQFIVICMARSTQ